jgi:hypothetical protein
MMGGTSLVNDAILDGGDVSEAVWRDRLQMALALADARHLRSLLTDCTPPIVTAQPIGNVKVQLAVPLTSGGWADAVLHFDRIHCTLLETQACAETGSCLLRPSQTSAELARMTRYESDLEVFGDHLNQAAAIALLAEVGFQTSAIHQILNLPRDAWHKSWWGQMDIDGSQTPFLRCIRTLRYADGSYSLQYKDFFEHIKPPCFVAISEQVLLLCPHPDLGVGQLLGQARQQSQSLGLSATVLVTRPLPPLEAEGLIHQGVSLYPLGNLRWARRAQCSECDRSVCPMQGRADSPVALCYQFVPR